jgi:hypothetical protein
LGHSCYLRFIAPRQLSSDWPSQLGTAGLCSSNAPDPRAAHEKSHGRYQTRTIKTIEALPGFPLAGTAQLFRIIRRAKSLGPGADWSVETAYGATSLTWDRASPTQIAELVRRHWAIENELHRPETSPSKKTSPRSAPATDRP